MQFTYLLIDFENVQPPAEDFSLIRGAGYRVLLFHGAHQNKFDADMVKALHQLGPSGLQYFQCERQGKNALDFHVSFYLGRLVQKHEAEAIPAKKQARFVIISKDSGFETLLRHVESLGYLAGRFTTIADALADSESLPRAALETKPADPAPATAKAAAPKPKKSAEKTVTAKAVPAKAAHPVPVAVKPPKTASPDLWGRAIAFLREQHKNRPKSIKKLEHHLKAGLGNGTTPAQVEGLVARMQQEGVVMLVGKKIEYKIPKTKLAK